MIAVPIIFTALCLLLGILFSMGKGASLIAGYNTSTEAEKAKIDEKKLCRLVGRLMFILTGCMVLFTLSIPLESRVLEWTSLALFFMSITGGLIYINTGNRIRRNVREDDLADTVQRAEEEYRKNHPEKGDSK